MNTLRPSSEIVISGAGVERNPGSPGICTSVPIYANVPGPAVVEMSHV
jgi:hypothetical protein